MHFWGAHSSSFPHTALQAELIQADLRVSDLCPGLASERTFAEVISFGQGSYSKGYTFRKNSVREKEVNTGSDSGSKTRVSSDDILCISFVTSSHGLPVPFLPLKTGWCVPLNQLGEWIQKTQNNSENSSWKFCSSGKTSGTQTWISFLLFP